MEANETTTTAAPAMPMRPTFLTVICILTFIGSGWGIIGSVRSYATADTASAMVNQSLDNAQDQMGSNSPGFLKTLMGQVENASSPSNIRKSSIIKLLSCLMTLIGAIMMWGLKKNGFYLYIAGIIVLVVAPVIIMGGLAGVMGATVTGFIGVVFIVMYGVNLKYMK